MPAFPEIRDARGKIGLAEVLHEAEAHHEPESDGHVRVAGEVEVDLHGICSRAEPCIDERRSVQCEDGVGEGRNRVGDEHLLAEPQHEPQGTCGEIPEGVGPLSELGREVPVPVDGTRYELRKQRDVRSQLQVALSHGCIPAVHVDQVTGRLEHVEGDADGKDHVQRRNRVGAEGAEECIEALEAEVSVLEIREDS